MAGLDLVDAVANNESEDVVAVNGVKIIGAVTAVLVLL